MGNMILDLFRKEIEFNNIQGYDDIKDIIRRAFAEANYNLLFIGPPASANTIFLLDILDMRKDGSNTTSRILDVLEKARSKIICIDELEKMSRQFQNQLLNFMESGRIKVDQMRRYYDFEIKAPKSLPHVMTNRLSKPLQSRFRRLPIPKYFREQFLQVAVKVCPELSHETALIIVEETWEQHETIRDVISVSNR